MCQTERFNLSTQYRKMKSVFTISLLLLYINMALASSNDTVGIADHLYRIDLSKKLIVVNAYTETINSQISEQANTILLDQHYHLSQSVNRFETGTPYELTNSTDESFTLYFTRLPLIDIETTNTIVDEPRRFARFQLTDGSERIISHPIGIELGGLSSLSQDKKNYRFEFWNDTLGVDTKDVSLMGMRSDDDWNLKSLFNEPLRIRSKVGFELWQRINSLYYSNIETKAYNGVRTEFAELFLNNEYQGVYLLSERVDRKQLQLKKTENETLGGELFKGVSWGASTFHECPVVDDTKWVWSGWEIRYPDDRIYWDNVYELVDLVVNSPDSLLFSSWQAHFSAGNAVDYFIFANLLRATDNMGKNIFLARYDDNEPYFYVPWDLDGILGTIWNGYREDITDDILNNGLYKKLFRDKREGGFTDLLSKRWKELRSDELSHQSVMELMNNNYHYLLENGVYDREQLAWPFSHRIDPQNMEYSADWLSRRIAYLDEVFTNTDLLSSIHKVDQPSGTNNISIYPNPATDHIVIDSESGTVVHSVNIRNAAGQLLIVDLLQDGNRLDLSTLPSGLYLVTFRLADRSMITQKLIKE